MARPASGMAGMGSKTGSSGTGMAGETAKRTSAPSHGRVATACVGVAVLMLGLAYASVPLYRLFCQMTGFAGTTQRATKAPGQVLDRIVTVRFDRSIGSGLGWTVEPLVHTMDVRLGETALAFYRATNTTGHAVRGTSTFNVTPDQAGGFFNKIECFCFKEQELQAGETLDMPVSFFVDPAMATDRDGRYITHITLSYTFYPVEGKGGSVAHKAAAAPSGDRALPSGDRKGS